MLGAKHQAPFGIACFRAPACGDGAYGSGRVAGAAVAHCPAALCVISYRPPLRVRPCRRRVLRRTTPARFSWIRPSKTAAYGFCQGSGDRGSAARFTQRGRRSRCHVFAPPIGSEYRNFCAACAGAAKGARCPPRSVVFPRTSRPNGKRSSPWEHLGKVHSSHTIGQDGSIIACIASALLDGAL